jgi:hypothetical protein
MERLFAADDWYWNGGFYELDIQLGPQSEERVQRALEALWANPRLEGPYLDRDREPADQKVVDPRGGISEVLSGIAALPDGAGVLCSSIVVLLDDGYELSLCIPVNALAVAWPQIGDFPFVGGRSSPADGGSEARRPLRAPRVPEDDDRAWQEPLEEWLAGFGRAVFDAVPFPVALIGFEGGLLSDDEERRLVEEMPEKRSVGVLRQEQDQLAWYPATSRGRFDVDWSQPDSWEGLFGLWRATWRLRLAVWGRGLRRRFGSSDRS